MQIYETVMLYPILFASVLTEEGLKDYCLHYLGMFHIILFKPEVFRIVTTGFQRHGHSLLMV